MTNNPFIIAEIAQGYEGSGKLVDFFVRAASAVGADAVKFQIFFADESAFPDYRHYALYKSLELPEETWQRAVQETQRRKMEFFSDVIGVRSFAMLERIGVDGYKIHTGSIKNTPLLKTVARAVSVSQKKVFLSTGGCSREEIDGALNIFHGCNVTLMHGFQAEPTDIEDNHLNRITTLRHVYGRPMGFMDHTAGDSELAPIVSFLALGLGATVIEKHLTLSRMAGMEDDISALTPEEFAVWVRQTRSAFGALGREEWILTEKERAYREKLKRAVCASRDILEGETVVEEDLILKRTSRTDYLTETSDVVGQRARRLILGDSIIRRDDLQSI